MKIIKKRGTNHPLPKVATGIEGFDEMSRGGLPLNRTTLVVGGPGAGKTIFAMQTLVNALSRRQEAGIFVAFEESPLQIITNGATFGWGLSLLAKSKIYLFDGSLTPETVQVGEFDLVGMLAMLKAKKQEIGAKWIVFDGIDVLLALLQNPHKEMLEMYRIRAWLAHNAMNAIITSKLDEEGDAPRYGSLQFMADCVVRLQRRIEYDVPMLRVGIKKYRGSGFHAGEFPVSFGPSGMEIGATDPIEIVHPASTSRISVGFERLDAMLGGGLFRGSSTLITGVPGTAKTSLAGKFAEAACLRGERTLYVSFDEGADQITRNLTSIGINLQPHVKSGRLLIYAARTEKNSAEDHLLKLNALIQTHKPRCVVIDPLTALAKSGGESAARAVATRLIYAIKNEGITIMVTALSEGENPAGESTDLQVSTIADTWIHLSYVVQSDERNRALTIVKSRGTQHSNQVRELILSAEGLTLSDVYSQGGEVLMGTLRWEKEAEERNRKTLHNAEYDFKRRELQFSEATTAAQIKALQMDLLRQRSTLGMYSVQNDLRKATSSARESNLLKLRSADSETRASHRTASRSAKKASKGVGK